MAASDFATPYRSTELAAAPTRRGRRLALLAGGWTLYGLVFAVLFSVLPSSVTPADAGRAWVHQLWLSLVPAWVWAAFTPAIVRTTRRLAARVARTAGGPAAGDLARGLAAHLALALAVCVATALARRGVNLWFGSRTTAAISFAFWLDHNVFTYAVLAGITHALDLHGRWLARARRELALQAELASAKLQFLRRQLQPHFLFNTLNATAELTREDPPRAQRMLRHLERLLRSALARSDAEEVALRDELATLEPYVELQRMRFDDSVQVVRRVDPAVLDARVPVFVLQPLLENAVQHGVAARRGGGTVEIVAEAEGDVLRLEVRDDGPGPRRVGGAPVGERRGGIGLRNTRSRLAQLYGAAQSLELVPREGGGTAAVVRIPLRPVTQPSGAYAAADPGPVARGAARRGSPGARVAHAASGAMPRVTATLETIPEPPDEDAALPDVALTGEMPTAALLAPPPPAASHLVRASLVVAAFWLVAGGVWMARNLLLQVAVRGEVFDLPMATIDVWNAVLWALLTPLVLAIARRVRVRRAHWPRAAALHVAIALVLDVAHMAALLELCRALGLIDRPLWHSGNVSQYTLNVVIYAGLVTWSHAREFAGWHRARVLSQARLDTAVAQARWQSLALELRPEFLLAVLERIAQLAPADPARAERLVERLADFMRGLLDTVGRPLQPLRAELALLEECLVLWGEATARDVAFDVAVPEGALARPVSSGTFRALTNALVAHDVAGDDRVAMTVGASARAGRLALTLHSSIPIRPDTGGDLAPYALMGAAFPDARTAELDLGPADPDDLPRASAPVITASA